MRHVHYTVVLIASLATGACTEQYLPEFGDSVPITVPSGKPAYGPRITQNSDEDAILSWMERRDDGSLLNFSTYSDGAWLPAITAVTDEAMFVNWADLPAVISIGNNSLLAYWLSYTADAPYAYQVLTSASGDDGSTWSLPESPHTDGTPTEHGFVSTFAAGNGTGLVWLDGRNTPDGGMTLRAATRLPDGKLSDEIQIDDLVCDCCQTDIAETDAGAIAVYRDRTTDEVRDIYVSRRIDGTWQTGQPLSNDGWVISGCPVNGPSIAAAGKRVAVAWFTAANGKPVVKTAVSKNSGRTFSDPVDISSKKVTGHVGAAMIDRFSYAVSWTESDKKETYAVKLRGMTFDGQLGRVHTVGRTSLTRTVPQMVRVGDHLLLTWTDEIAGLSKVVSVEVPILGFYD